MARKIEGGASELVQVTTDESLVDTNLAIPVYGFSDGQRGILQGSDPVLVYVVPEADVLSGKYKVLGGSAQSVVDVANVVTSRESKDSGAIPVYVVGGTLGSTYDWHVDSINGSDGNTGKTPSTAFKTIVKLATVWQAGESVGLANGSHWREQLDIPGDNCTVEAYGTGNKPILDASDVETSWSKTAGRTNVYEASVPHDASAQTWLSVWEDAARFPIVADLATLDATPGSYYTADHTTSPATIYIHTTASDNPATNGSTYEVSVRRYALTGFNGGFGARDGCAVSGLQLQRGTHANGCLEMATNSTIADCVVIDGTKHSIYIADGSSLTDVHARNCYYGTTAATIFVHNQNTPTGLGVTYTRCIAEQEVGTPGYRIGSVTGFHGHTNAGGTFGTVTMVDCQASNLGPAVTSGSSDTLVISGFIVTNCPLYIRVVVTTTMTGGSFTNSAIANARLLTFQGSGASCAVDGLTMTQSDTGTIQTGAFYIDQTNTTLSVQNSVFNGAFTMFAIGGSATTGATWTFDGNTYNLTAGRYYDFVGAALPVGFTSDNNHFQLGTLFSRVSNTNYNVADWQSTFSQDANSTVG